MSRTIGVQFPAAARDFSLLRRVQICLGVHPLCYPMETGPFLRKQRGGAKKLTRHVNVVTRLRMREAIPPLPGKFSRRGA
jgi:hypothetical protein